MKKEELSWVLGGLGRREWDGREGERTKEEADEQEIESKRLELLVS